MAEEPKVQRASYSLEMEYQELFREIASTTRRTMTEELRLMLDARAIVLGLKPIQAVDPKSFALIRKPKSATESAGVPA